MAYLGVVHRWELFWADLEPHIGREQAGERRPVLVLSNDGANRSFEVVTVVPLTKLEGKGRPPRPWEVPLAADAVGRGYTSLALPNQIRTISKIRLLARIGLLADQETRFAIEGAVLDHLGIQMDE
jgi:mRNA interferase MazF